MKSLLVALSVIFLTSILFAQEKQEYILHLKNGSIIRGVIIEIKPDSTVKINTRDGNIFVYQMREIEKIEKSTTEKVQSNQSNKEDKSVYFGIGLLTGKLAGNESNASDEDIAGLIGPNGEGFNSFGIIGGFDIHSQLSLRFDVERYKLEKSFVDNLYKNKWKWGVTTFGLSAQYNVPISNSQSKYRVFTGFFGGPILGNVSVNGEEYNPFTGNTSEGSENNTNLGLRIGANLTINFPNNALGAVLEATYVRLKTTVFDEIDVNVGYYSIGLFIKFNIPIGKGK